MHITLNKRAAFLLYCTINIVHFIECTTEDQLKASPSNTDPAIVLQKTEPIVQAVEPSTIQQNTETNQIRVKQVRASAFRMGNQPNFRSSYVGSKLSRRITTAVNNDEHTKNAVITPATEEIPIIKTKRKLNEDFNDEIRYNVGPGVNIGVEKEKELVSVYLDEDCLKDVFTGI